MTKKKIMTFEPI